MPHFDEKKFLSSKTCTTEPCLKKKILTITFLLNVPASCLLSYISSHISCLTSSVSCILSHNQLSNVSHLLLLSLVSCLFSSVSCLVSHVLRLLSYFSCLMSPISRLLSHTVLGNYAIFIANTPLMGLKKGGIHQGGLKENKNSSVAAARK